MTSFDFRIDEILFSGADTPIPVGSDLTVIVGPNNSGKSRALREIRDYLRAGTTGAVVTRANTSKKGDAEAVSRWLESTTKPAPNQPPGTDMRQGIGGAGIEKSGVASIWELPVLVNLAPFIVGLINTEQRLTLTASQNNIDVLSKSPAQPMQVLLADPRVEHKLSDAVVRAFGEQISVTRIAGTTIHLMLGRPAVAVVADDAEYLEQVRDLGRVDDQGDGMRSFIGLMLAVLASPYRVLLIDEAVLRR